MASEWTNEAAIRQWDAATTRAAMEAVAEGGDFAKRHLVNPTLLRLLGDVRGRRVLDAGCGNGYFSRLLAERGARVVGVEPTEAMSAFVREKEAELRQGVTYVPLGVPQRTGLPRLPPACGRRAG
ncbi:MAG: class I SAM-dependent methyltransferase, partial [Actinomadura sp.]